MSVGAQTNDGPSEAETRHRAELDAQREEFHRELSRRAFRIGELEQEMIEVAQTYETSLSWRLTRPVRATRTLLAKLRG
ncbi:MAG TPA: hypothetical protein VFI09_03265 [Solirubrobacterales bacterium]|nr:hypothetical protein [Solirubrobacterales bacterium]